MSRRYALQQAIIKQSGQLLAQVVPDSVQQSMIHAVSHTNPNVILQGLGPTMNQFWEMQNLAVDLPVEEHLHFEHLAGLFANSSLNHGILAQTIRDAAYMYGYVRQKQVRKAIEIGRYKGGSTILIAAAMQNQGVLWSLDLGKKEKRLAPDGKQIASFDDQLHVQLEKLNITNVQVLVGDSRTYELDTDGDVDFVFIDGDHSYEGVKNDFERFGRRVGIGGAVIFDDSQGDEFFKVGHVESVGRLVDEILAKGDFRLVKYVSRFAHLERIR